MVLKKRNIKPGKHYLKFTEKLAWYLIQDNMNYRIKLQNFEGPLDLLLFFISRDKINIYDIPIYKITDEFFKYIEMMKQLKKIKKIENLKKL